MISCPQELARGWLAGDAGCPRPQTGALPVLPTPCGPADGRIAVAPCHRPVRDGATDQDNGHQKTLFCAEDTKDKTNG